jgi:gamma-glutamylcysteine synthetase
MRQQGYFESYTVAILMGTAGGPQPTLCLMASAVPLFLTGVELERVQDEDTRQLLTAFLDEAHTVLAEHFGISERGEIQFLRDSVARMVAEQEKFEETLSKKVEAELVELRKAHEEKVQQIRDAFSNLRQQVTRLEAVAGPKVRLSPEQLGQLRQLVATLGTLLQENGVSKPYPGIYMDITRLTGVSRSEDIRQEDFAEVVAFLEQQVQALVQSSAKSKPAAQ